MKDNKERDSLDCDVLGVNLELVKITELHDFIGHLFKVIEDDSLFELANMLPLADQYTEKGG